MCARARACVRAQPVVYICMEKEREKRVLTQFLFPKGFLEVVLDFCLKLAERLEEENLLILDALAR